MDGKFILFMLINRYLSFAGILWALNISEHYMIDGFWIWCCFTAIQDFITPI